MPSGERCGNRRCRIEVSRAHHSTRRAGYAKGGLLEARANRSRALNGVDAPACVVNNAWTMSQKLAGKRLAVLGTGKLGGILLRAYLKQGLFDAGRVTATVKHAEKAASLAKELGVAATTENRKAVHGADIVLLGVKPQVVGELLKEIAPELSEKTLVIPVAASRSA